MKMKVRDLLAMDVCVDVADDYDERLWIAFDGAVSLTEIGGDVFKEALDLEVKLTTPSDALVICRNAREAETVKELFESLAGYCTEDEWELWFEEV